MEELANLDWLVDSRCKIQRLLFKLYAFAKQNPERVPQQTLQCQLLVAVGFALWRAAFLADGELTWENIDKASTSFLKELVEDNAIGYVQDRRNKNWTFGYYVNDAYLRLAQYRQTLGLEPMHAQRAQAFLEAQIDAVDGADAHAAWNQAYDAASSALNKLSASQ
jgi:hypothetical protein